MIHSIRRFLLISLIIAVTVASSITAIGNYLLDKQIITPYLNEQLINRFVCMDAGTNKKMTLAQQTEMRNKLTDLITRNNTYVTLITYPIFAILIWLIIGIALRSMTRLTNQLAKRTSASMEPVNADKIPIEIKPLIDELNLLLGRLNLAFERNKHFAADTAHELRTPLAALKTQAQVALKITDEIEPRDALLKVMQGVDRCSHIVTQLLTLSSLSQEEAVNNIRPIHLHKLTTDILTYLVPIALEKNIEVELAPPPRDSIILGNEIALGILIRNLVDNAIRYTPSRGAVTVAIINTNNAITLRVTDTGAGIPIELHERVFDRFYRILGTTQTGSGLGLAIVKQIAELHHAQIHLDTPANGVGLQIDILFHKPSTHRTSLPTSRQKQRKHGGQ